MTLTTGTPLGNIVTQEDRFLEGSPYLYIQDYRAGSLNHPDANGYYWNLSGTSTYPVYSLGCIQDVKMTDNVTLNMIRCDTVGNKAAIQRRNEVDVDFQLNSLLPLAVTKILMNMFDSLEVSGREYVGIGKINNNQYWQVYAPKIYDDVAGYWIMAHFARCQVVGNFVWDMNINGHKLTGIKIAALVDETKPANQLFGCLARFDASALP
jgi:hypothetical protein